MAMACVSVLFNLASNEEAIYSCESQREPETFSFETEEFPINNVICLTFA